MAKAKETTKIISRQEAKDSDLPKFFTGEECAQGHIAERYVSSGRCYTCSYNPSKQLERQSSPRRRVRSLLTQAKTRAKRDGLVFEDRVRDQYTTNPPEFCECCGLKLNYSSGRGSSYPDSPSFDRKINALGYTLENTHALCMRCNRLKSDGSVAEFNQLIAYIERD